MRLGVPIPWERVWRGALVLLVSTDVPRTVIDIAPAAAPGFLIIFAEGLAAPISRHMHDTVWPVEFDEADAVAVLRAAGFTTEEI